MTSHEYRRRMLKACEKIKPRIKIIKIMLPINNEDMASIRRGATLTVSFPLETLFASSSEGLSIESASVGLDKGAKCVLFLNVKRK